VIAVGDNGQVKRMGGPANDPGYDVVVIGGGAAGLSAALVLGRARRRVTVIDAGAPRNAPAEHMQGYLSRDGMPPRDLVAVGRAEVAGYGVEVVDGKVDHLEPSSGTETVVHLAGGPALRARRVLVATGLRDELPDIPGLWKRWGKDVLHCPYCHGYEVRDQPIGVLGSQPGSVHHALLLGQWSNDVVFFPHTLELTPADREKLIARGVTLTEGRIKRLAMTDDRLHGVELATGQVVSRDAIFVATRMVPNDELLRDLGCATGDNGWIAVDPTGRTSHPGVWAVGNVTDQRAQVITAASAGSVAAIAINHDLLEEEIESAVAALRQR
jgi:thioredoxin reductase